MIVKARRIGAHASVFRRHLPDDEAVPDILGQPSLVLSEQRLAQFFTRPNADELAYVPRRYGLCHVGNSVGRQLGHKYLSSPHHGKAGQDELDSLVQCHVEPSHARIRDRKRPALCHALLEQRNDRATRAPHIAVARNRNQRFANADLVERDKILLSHQLGRAVVIDRIARLVRRERDNSRDASVHGSIADVHCAIDISLATLVWISFAFRNDLERRRVDDKIDPAHGNPEPITIANVPDKEPEGRMIEIPLHLLLKMLAATIDDKPPRTITQNTTSECLTKTAGSASDQNRSIFHGFSSHAN